MTTQATHTLGPWKEKRKLAIYSADDEPICTVLPAETDEQSAADARLIAAAPDMLAALQTIAAGNTDPDRTVEIAAEALRKAEGEQ